MNFEERYKQGPFVPIIEENLQVSLDRSLVLKNDSIAGGTNLLSNGIAEIELYTVPLNNEQVPDCYIIWLNKRGDLLYSLNRGYYTVYIDATTKNQDRIQDSTVIFIQ